MIPGAFQGDAGTARSCLPSLLAEQPLINCPSTHAPSEEGQMARVRCDPLIVRRETGGHFGFGLAHKIKLRFTPVRAYSSSKQSDM